MTDRSPVSSHSSLLEHLQRAMEQMPFLNWLGVRIVRLERGRATVEMPVRPEMLQVAGLLHGGVIASLIDVVAALATMSAMRELQEIRTLEMKINYFRPVRGGTVQARGESLYLGQRTAVTQAFVRLLERRQRVAMGVVTFAVIPEGTAPTRIIQ